MQYATSLLASAFVTHDTRRFTLERPDGFSFTPGQGVQLTIEHDPWCGQEHPFTPTSLPSDRVLEFVIKRYGEGSGFTRALHRSVPGTPMTIGEAFGTIR